MKHLIRGGRDVIFFDQSEVPGAFFEMAKNLKYNVYPTGNNGAPTHSIFITKDDMVSLLGLSGATDEQIREALKAEEILLDAREWHEPKVVSNVDIAFGGSMKDLLPPWNTIPKEFQDEKTPWNKLAVSWWCGKLARATFTPKDGIDALKAKAHIRAILVSFDPSTEHKMAGCAWLMSLWFESID